MCNYSFAGGGPGHAPGSARLAGLYSILADNQFLWVSRLITSVCRSVVVAALVVALLSVFRLQHVFQQM